MDSSNLLYALLLTAFAGLSTGIGSTIAFSRRIWRAPLEYIRINS